MSSGLITQSSSQLCVFWSCVSREISKKVGSCSFYTMVSSFLIVIKRKKIKKLHIWTTGNSFKNILTLLVLRIESLKIIIHKNFKVNSLQNVHNHIMWKKIKMVSLMLSNTYTKSVKLNWFIEHKFCAKVDIALESYHFCQHGKLCSRVVGIFHVIFQ